MALRSGPLTPAICLTAVREHWKREKHPFMFQLFLSSSAPSEIASRLNEFVDHEEMDAQQPSLYRGQRPIIGRVEGVRFYLRKRSKAPWYLEVLTPAFWFKPALYGTISQKGPGSEILLEGGAPLAAKISWACAFIGAAAGFGLCTIFCYTVFLNFDGPHSAYDMQLTLLLMNIALAILLLIPFLGWVATRNELSYLVSELQSRLHLQPTSKTGS
jgi:hypothetical protein